MIPNTEILRQAQTHVTALLSEKLPQWAVYHNLLHTEQVVDAAHEIGEGIRLGKSEMEVVLVAALFHDVGYIDAVEGHEERAAGIGTEFLSAKNYPQPRIDLVVGCIRATKMPQSPKNSLEEVMCDADLSHIGKKRFFDRSDLLRMETEMRTGVTMSDVDWLQKNIEFASSGTFFTLYAREEWSGRRRKNLIELQERMRNALARASKATGGVQTGKEKGKVEKPKRPERGIETMFRVAPKNHLDLTALADHKASMLIGTTGTIKAIVFSVLVSKLDTHAYLLIPTIILLTVSLTTMIFAILATRPNVTTGVFTREDIKTRKVNLLFFGNFYNSSLEDFEWGIKEMMNDSEYLYSSMIKDLYFLGRVVGMKFRYLRIAYNVFMWGLIISVLAFAIAIMNAPPVAPLQ